MEMVCHMGWVSLWLFGFPFNQFTSFHSRLRSLLWSLIDRLCTGSMHAWWLLPRLHFIHEHVKALAWWSNPNHVQATWYTLLFSIAMCMTIPPSAPTQSLNYICTSHAVTHHSCDLYPESTDWVIWGYQPQHYQLQLCGHRLFTPACPIHYIH